MKKMIIETIDKEENIEEGTLKITAMNLYQNIPETLIIETIETIIE